jgi:uncharacterized protein (DUF58 family)
MPRFIPFLLALFLLAAVLRVDFYFTIAYLFFAVYVLARVWTRRGLAGVRVERRFTAHAFHGDDVPVNVRVSNTGRLPLPWLHVHESLPLDLITPPFQQTVVSLGAREHYDLHYTLHCHKRGYYPLGPLRAQTGDVLGLEAFRGLEAAPNHLIVYPRVVPLHRLGLPTRSPLAALPARSPVFEDPARVAGVRGYARGDSPRRIHWTASARAGQLLVKRYQPAIARETLVCLDLDPDSYNFRHWREAAELAIVVAASLANHIIVREHLPAGLAAEALDSVVNERRRFFLPPRKERAHLIAILETLARAQFIHGPPLADVLRRERPHLAWGTTLAVITGNADDSLFENLTVLRRAGFAVALILVRPDVNAAARQRAAALSLALHHVWNERDLEHWA